MVLHVCNNAESVDVYNLFKYFPIFRIKIMP